MSNLSFFLGYSMVLILKNVDSISCSTRTNLLGQQDFDIFTNRHKNKGIVDEICFILMYIFPNKK